MKIARLKFLLAAMAATFGLGTVAGMPAHAQSASDIPPNLSAPDAIPAPDAYANDTRELARTWAKGRFYRPVGKAVLAAHLSRAQDALDQIPPHAQVILYMHGCSGIDELSGASAVFLANLGYYVVQPNSYARAHKPVSCDAQKATGGFHRGVLAWRHAEVTYALRKLRALPNGASFKIALQGLSEGGITTATYDGDPVDARVIEGWGCHSYWNEYRGLNAPSVQPVLALVGDYDPWFRPSYLQGDCGPFMENRRLQKSAVFYPPHELAYYHYLLWHPRAQKLVRNFYQKHLR